MRVKSHDGYELTLSKDPTHDGEGHIVVHLEHPNGQELWGSFSVADIVEALPIGFTGGVKEREKAPEEPQPPAECGDDCGTPGNRIERGCDDCDMGPQPPAELVEFAERHGVEVEQCARRPYRHKVEVSCVSIFAGDGDQTRIYCHHEGHDYADGNTINEALASLAAATVDDEEAHLEVCGLMTRESLERIFEAPDGLEVHWDHGVWVCQDVGQTLSRFGQTPWFAVMGFELAVDERALSAFKLREACREWRKANA